MNPSLAVHSAMAVDLNAPGSYLTWSIFTISEANLVLIAVMVAIFGIALLAPFPSRRHGSATSAQPEPGGVPEPAGPVESSGAADPPRIAASGDDADARMWTARVRRRALSLLPPDKLLPDRQPAYVASWVYVFGVATLAALGMAIVSGFAIALGGAPHRRPVGRDERDGQLPRAAVAVALVPRPRLAQLGQRRPDRHLHDRPRHGGPAA